MNCALHPDSTAVSYCRTCGKALCERCQRDVQGTIFCEACLAARMQGDLRQPGEPEAGNFGAAGGGGYGAGGGREDASPGLALFLGFIPGVGAFYNGQFLKGFVHVLVMSTLIWMSDHGMETFAGLLIAAWVFYMVFDAYTTAKARRQGQPIPDPIGLNAILEGREGTFRQRAEQAGERIGSHMEYAAQNIGQHWHRAGGAAPGGSAGVKAGDAAGAPPEQGPYSAGDSRRGEHSPVGAVALIGIGVLLLLANLGWFSFYWVLHYWPVVLIAVGVWLFVERGRQAR
jgi:TM2 domain-containing membrane protein YozV